MLVHGRPWVYWDDGFRGWWTVAQSTVWSHRVVASPPLFDYDWCLFEGAEDFPIEQFIPEAGVEALAVGVFPG
jgi:hypothetical protein